jgi:hypothetical protein
LTRPGDPGTARDPSPPPAIAPILARLSGEIRHPLELLRGGIDRLLGDSSRSITEAERAQAQTMLGLCEDLDRLTRECLEGDRPSDEQS